MDIRKYQDIITTTFPDLIHAEFIPHDKGWDSLAIEVDGHLIFKFPREQDAGALFREASILRHVRPKTTMRVPDMVCYSDPVPFTRHEKIKGDHLGTAEYGRLTADSRKKLAHAMASFYAGSSRY